ncbi:MAG: LysR family transcriptional regulator ArgP [Solirubrobacterales bacterium]|nr:LysR family transcriptional regulator ArgP [Solirubrobacterales bacterium]
MRLDVDQLQALAAAVTEGSFDRAASRLHITPSAVSQRIKALETSVGQVLLVRARPVHPTIPGESLLRAARQIEAITGDVIRELGEPGGGDVPVVALAVNADSLATWLAPALAAVDPPVTFDLRRADETRTVELLRDGSVIAAVTASRDPVAGCTVDPLGRMRYRPRASRAFAARWFSDGPTADALAWAPLVSFDRSDQLQDRYLKRRTRRRLHPPRHFVPGSSAFAQAVRLGLGWGMVPDLQAQDDAELVDLDPQGAIDVPLFWQQWRLRSAALERVADAVRAHAATALLSGRGQASRAR